MSASRPSSSAQAELEQIVERLERGDVGLDELDEALGARRGALPAAAPSSSPARRADRGARASARRRARPLGQNEPHGHRRHDRPKRSGRRAATSRERRTTSRSCCGELDDDAARGDPGAARRGRRAARRGDRGARRALGPRHLDDERRARRALRLGPDDDQGLSVEDTEAEIEFNVELRPSNFFDEARPGGRASRRGTWGPASGTSRARCSSCASPRSRAASTRSRRRRPTSRSRATTRPRRRSTAFAKYVDDLVELALSREPTTEAWQSMSTSTARALRRASRRSRVRLARGARAPRRARRDPRARAAPGRR